jgi:hypothetical protein
MTATATATMSPQRVEEHVPAEQTVRESSSSSSPTTLLKHASYHRGEHLSLKPLDLGTEQSLTSIMSSRRATHQSMHKKFAYEIMGCSSRNNSVSFDMPKPTSAVPQSISSTIDSEHTQPAVTPSSSCEEPPMKRRRFQRRNSQTAAMLFSSLASFAESDFGALETQRDENEASLEETIKTESESPCWDGGLEIAEELVRQLKLRRQCSQSQSHHVV